MSSKTNGEAPIKASTSLAEAMAYLVKASGLIQIIQDSVAEAMRNYASLPKQETKEKAPEYYTKSELCQLLHITETTLWRLENKGVIRKIKVGRKNLYLRSDIDELIASGGSFESSTTSSAAKNLGK